MFENDSLLSDSLDITEESSHSGFEVLDMKLSPSPDDDDSTVDLIGDPYNLGSKTDIEIDEEDEEDEQDEEDGIGDLTETQPRYHGKRDLSRESVTFSEVQQEKLRGMESRPSNPIAPPSNRSEPLLQVPPVGSHQGPHRGSIQGPRGTYVAPPHHARGPSNVGNHARGPSNVGNHARAPSVGNHIRAPSIGNHARARSIGMHPVGGPPMPQRRGSAASFGRQPQFFPHPAQFSIPHDDLDDYVPPDPREGDLDVHNWNVGDVMQWVQSLEGGILTAYVPFFGQLNVTGQVLLELTSSSLAEFNIRSVGHRQIFLHHLRLLKKSGMVETGGQRFLVPPNGVVIRMQHLRVRQYETKNEPTWWSTLTGLLRDRNFHILLESVSATLLPGRITGIIGSLQRETLLQVLSGFNLNPDWVVTGDILVNNVPFHDSLMATGIASYIDSSNLCEGFDEMTVGDVINLAVSLSKPKENVEDPIKDILRLINLSHPRKTRIKNLTQYEKLKLQICLDVLVGNSLILLNDPLSKLTSPESLSLLHFLQDFSRRKSLTIVIAVDRLRYHLFLDYIEQVLVLGDIEDVYNMDNVDDDRPFSSLCFTGTPGDALEWFGANGTEYKLYENPIDTVINQIQEEPNYQHIFAERSASFKYRQKRGAVNIHDFDHGAVNGFCKEFYIIINFVISSSFNDIVKFDLELFILLIWCLIIGLCFWDVGTKFKGTNERLKLIILIGLTPYLGLPSFIQFRNRQRMWTEKSTISQRIRVIMVAVSYVFLGIFRGIIISVLCLIPWWMARLSSQNDVIIKFLLLQTLNSAVTAILGLIAVDTLHPKLERLARIVYFLVVWICVLTGGFLVSSDDIVPIFEWISRVSYIAYVMEGLLSLDLSHVSGGVKQLHNLGMQNQFYVDFGIVSLWLFLVCIIYWYVLSRRYHHQLELGGQFQSGELTAPDLPLTNLQRTGLQTPLLFQQPIHGVPITEPVQEEKEVRRPPPIPVGVQKSFNMSEMMGEAELTPMDDDNDNGGSEDKKIKLEEEDLGNSKTPLLSLYRISIIDHSRSELKMEDISFHIRESTLMGVVGPNNLDKSLLLNVICGWNQSNEKLEVGGSLCIEGCELRESASLLRIGFVSLVSQEFVLPEHLTCLDAVNHVLELNRPGSVEARPNRALKLLKEVEVDHRKNIKIRNLTPGDKTRVAIAYFCLANDSQVFILDNILAGLALLEMSEIMQMLHELCRKKRKGIFMTIHSVPNFIITDYVDELLVLTHKDENMVLLHQGKPDKIYAFFQKRFATSHYENASDELIDIISRTDPSSKSELERLIIENRNDFPIPHAHPNYRIKKQKKKGFLTEHKILFKFIVDYLKSMPSFYISLFDIFIKTFVIGFLYMGMSRTDWNIMGSGLALVLTAALHANSYLILEPLLQICDTSVLHGQCSFGSFTVVFSSTQFLLSLIWSLLIVTIPFTFIGIFSLSTFLGSVFTFCFVSFFWDSVMLVGFCYKGSYSTGRFWTHILIPVFTLFSGYFISSKNIPGYLHFLYTLNPIRICLENIIIVIFNREDKRNKLKEYGFHNSKYRIIWNVLLLSLLSCILRLIGFYFQKRRLRPLRIESKDGENNPIGVIHDQSSASESSSSSIISEDFKGLQVDGLESNDEDDVNISPSESLSDMDDLIGNLADKKPLELVDHSQSIASLFDNESSVILTEDLLGKIDLESEGSSDEDDSFDDEMVAPSPEREFDILGDL